MSELLGTVVRNKWSPDKVCANECCSLVQLQFSLQCSGIHIVKIICDELTSTLVQVCKLFNMVNWFTEYDNDMNTITFYNDFIISK